MRLYCFAYAGGNGSIFLPWQDLIHPSIEICAVQLPGRGARLSEPPAKSLSEVVEQVAQVVLQQGGQRFAFFGHSLGGLIAFELARYCERHYLPAPERIFVSGCGAPQFRGPLRRVHELGDSALIDVLKDFDGTPVDLLENTELMTLLLPSIRADFGLVADYKYQPNRLLNTPISVLAGTEDAHVSPIQVGGWQKETNKEIRVRWFDGGHFFLHPQKVEIIDYLNCELLSAE
ncbi:thioesterase II family protein [Collimonas pratensis]|uniref:thioesterase II family protein n=1 Tax=Collimonas pratensis TaxID=279113 RepID=UPI001F113D24|nr:alpha/beta fold hydrolase [Collimonas pratensis]